MSIDFQLHPTIYFECFVIDSVNNNKIYEIIKRVFYNPPINANRFLIHEFKQPFTVEKLCEVIRLENYDFLFSSHDNTIERLNELLTITNFYIQIRQRSDNINLSKEMSLLLENTKESWNKNFSQLNTYEQINICRFNRLLLDGVYPAETPKSPKQRFDLNKHGILQTLPAGKE